MSKIVNKDGLYTIPVYWQVFSTIQVEADNLEQAAKIARERIADIPLSEGEYVDETYEIGTDEDILSAQDYRKFSDIVIRKDGTIEH